MRRLITLLLILPALAVGQSRFGHGGSGGVSVSSLLPIIADSTLWHLQGADTLVTDGALPIKVSGIRVSGTTRLDGNLTLITTAAESLTIAAGGIRNEGGFIQKGNSAFGVQQVPKSTVQITGTGISAANYYKGIRLSNTDAAADGVQAFSPALVFRGAGWKTNSTAGSDSLLFALYNMPAQGSASPSAKLMLDAKIGAASWVNVANLNSAGSLTLPLGSIFLGTAASYFAVSIGYGSFSAEDNVYIIMDNNNDDSDTRAIVFAKNSLIGSNATELGRIEETGQFKNNFNISTWDSLDVQREKSVIADDGTITIATGVAGWGSVMACTAGTGAREQWADFDFDIDGSVHLKANSALVSKTATAGDDSLMIYDAGSGIAIKNRLGATKIIKLNIHY